MKLKVYSVFDSKVGAYKEPFYCRARGEALRIWETTVNNEKTEFFLYPGDFTLMELGEFDLLTGKFECPLTVVSLGTALEFRRDAKAPVSLPKAVGGN